MLFFSQFIGAKVFPFTKHVNISGTVTKHVNKCDEHVKKIDKSGTILSIF